MAKPKNSQSCFAFPSQIFSSPAPSSFSVLSSRKKKWRQADHKLCNTSSLISFIFFSLLVFLTLTGVFKISSIRRLAQSSICSSHSPPPPISLSLFTSSKFSIKKSQESSTMPLHVHRIDGNMSQEESEFWQQPDGFGLQPCLDFGLGYRKKSAKIVQEKKRFLMVVVAGGLNQQRSQIVDAVVIARILEAALVLPVLKVNVIWEDESEFSDIFDVEYFKNALRSDVRIVSTLPSTALMLRPSAERRMPANASPLWIRTKYSKRLQKEGVLLLNGLESRLSMDLPEDLQKLRCKVAFHALRFAAPILEIGNRLAQRMWSQGPYIALHLRLEKDVWIRTGCLPGLGPDYDDIIAKERESRQELLTGKLNMSYHQRKVAGFCPLNAREVARVLKALGAPRTARIYCAGGEPFGGKQALQPLMAEFPHLYNSYTLALPGELTPFSGRSSALAAIDYIVSLSSDVFMPSHGGNMGRFIKGHRAFVGHRKFITPNKRYLSETKLSGEAFSSAMKRVHRDSIGQPQPRTNKNGRDVIAYPVPECMCCKPHHPHIF